MTEKRHSDKLFYGRYTDGIEFVVREASVLRGMGTGKQPSWVEVQHRILNRREWRKMWNMRYGAFLGATEMPRTEDIRDYDCDRLKLVHELLQDDDVDYKFVVTQDQVRVYSNDMKFLDRLCADLPVFVHRFQVLVDRAPDTLIRKRSQYTHRCYFRNRGLTQQQKKHLAQYLKNQSDSLQLSRTMQQWLESNGTRLQEWFFLDYNDQHVINMLDIIVPDIKRKILKLVTDK